MFYYYLPISWNTGPGELQLASIEIGQQSSADITCLDSDLVNFTYFQRMYYLEFMMLQNLINEIPSPIYWNNDMQYKFWAIFSIQYISLHELRIEKLLKFYIRSTIKTIYLTSIHRKFM